MRTLPSKSIDIVFTSPPYNLQTHITKGKNYWLTVGKMKKSRLGKGYAASKDDMPYDEYVRWQKSVLLECWRLLTDTGAIFYNHKPRIQDGLLYTPLDLNPGLPVRQILIWKRAGGINCSPTFFMSTHEWIVIFAKPAFQIRDRSASGIGDVWEIHQGNQSNQPKHPAPFPMELPLRALTALRKEERVILDPFMGSGTTGAACMKTKRDFIGIDISKEYCDMARNRISLAQRGDFYSWMEYGN
jgi:site-specific DNA-methyltransferase (adenine-specific)